MSIDNQQIRYAWAEIDLRKLDRNLKLLQDQAKGSRTKLMAVVKADAYGHGAVEVGRRAIKAGAYGLGVALVQEGQQLRRGGLNCPIYVLGEIPSPAVDQAISADLTPCLSSWEKASEFDSRAKSAGRKIKCHLNIDTGMRRLGINHEQACQKIEAIARLSHIKIEGIFTHLACASNPSSPANSMQLKRFKQVLEEVGALVDDIEFVHTANSAACIDQHDLSFNMFRVGIAMYGLNPFDRTCPIGLEPVMALKSRITFLKEVASGQGISYCQTFRAKRDSLIAVIPLGYADGYSRLFSNKARVIIGGQYAPVVGNVTMDQIMVDVTGLEVSIGDQVILIGAEEDKSVSADDLAAIMGTINYEIVCMIGPRIPRIYIR